MDDGRQKINFVLGIDERLGRPKDIKFTFDDVVPACTLLHHKAYTARGYRSKIQMCMHNNVFFFIFIFLCILVPGYLFTSRLPCHLSLVTFLKAES